MPKIGTAKIVGTPRVAIYMRPRQDLVGEQALIADVESMPGFVGAQFDNVEEYKYGWHIFIKASFELREYFCDRCGRIIEEHFCDRCGRIIEECDYCGDANCEVCS